MFDLRSDTVTAPTPAMRSAMRDAEVGDDVLGEDPSVNQLEQTAADLFGTEAALFVPSGTMGNQISLGVLARAGDEILAESQAHILLNEAGAASRLWGCTIRSVPGTRGAMDRAAVLNLLRDAADIHHPRSGVLSLENTHNYAGGTVLPIQHVEAMSALARERGLAVHMDGARLFNAQAATGVPVARWVKGVDLTSVCLSKGLGAPVGSLVVGSTMHIEAARRLRKLLGGGMRQAGVLAAPALIALTEGPAALVEDHRRARALAAELAGLPGLEIDLDSVQTNIVIGRVAGAGSSNAWDLEARFKQQGVLIFALDTERIRFVFHRDVGDDALDAAVSAARRILD